MVIEQLFFVQNVKNNLLLLLIKNKGGLCVHTGKLFEYLRAKKIILALVPNKGEAAKILRESNHNHICDINDERMILKKLRTCMVVF